MLTFSDNCLPVSKLRLASLYRACVFPITLFLSTLCLPSFTGEMPLVGSVKGEYGAIAVQRGYAYVAEGPFIRILNVKHPADPETIGSRELPGNVVDIEVSHPNLYVTCHPMPGNKGKDSGLQILDVSILCRPFSAVHICRETSSVSL